MIKEHSLVKIHMEARRLSHNRLGEMIGLGTFDSIVDDFITQRKWLRASLNICEV